MKAAAPSPTTPRRTTRDVTRNAPVVNENASAVAPPASARQTTPTIDVNRRGVRYSSHRSSCALVLGLSVGGGNRVTWAHQLRKVGQCPS